MKRLSIAFTLAVLLCGVGVATSGAQGQGQGQGNQGQGGPPPVAEPPMSGIQWARGQARPGGGGGSPLLVYHGGPIMSTGAYVEPIFWGPRWSDSAFVGDKIAGLQSFYGGMGAIVLRGHQHRVHPDRRRARRHDRDAGQRRTWISRLPPRTEAARRRFSPRRAAQATNLMTDGYYPVYIDQPRGHAGYCAWHSAGTCPNGVTIQFAFFFNLDGDPGCDPEDTSGSHSQGLAALANVSGHELSEALTDPHLNAWYDASGAENSDKCAWSFGTPLLTFSNGSSWKIQGNWSNAAFNAGTGYPNSSGQKGCLDGGNFK